jgi:serine/threonine protein kinase
MAEDPLEGAEIVGSPSWMAPEQAAGALPAPPADVWSLCALGHWLVTGRTLFVGSADVVLAERQAGALPGFEDTAFPAGAAPLVLILKAGLALDPERRPGLRDFLDFARAHL